MIDIMRFKTLLNKASNCIRKRI